MSGLDLGLGMRARKVALSSVAPSNTALPHFIDGAGATVTAPIVGQTYQVHPGTWTGSPTDYSYSISNTIGNNSGSWNATDPLPTFTAQDGDIGNAYTLTVTANNGLTASASSTPTSAVADVNLAAAITSVTRTSASGVTPMTADIAFASNVYEGYTLRRTVYTDSGLSSLKGEAVHLLTNADLQAGATIDWSGDGGPTIAATDWVQYTVQTTTPNGIYKSFTYGTAISPTDASATTKWSAASSSANYTITNVGLTATLGGPSSTDNLLKADTGKATAGTFTATVTRSGTDDIAVGFGQASTASGAWAGSTGTIAYHANGNIWMNGSIVATGMPTFTTGDVIKAEDNGSRQIKFYKNGIVISGTAIDASAVVTTTPYPICSGVQSGDVFTGNFAGWV